MKAYVIIAIFSLIIFYLYTNRRKFTAEELLILRKYRTARPEVGQNWYLDPSGNKILVDDGGNPV